MKDLNRWYSCKDNKPERKGMYLLLVSVPRCSGNYHELGVIDAFWNGRTWMIDDAIKPSQWKFKKSGELDKYPDFFNNNRYIKST